MRRVAWWLLGVGGVAALVAAVLAVSRWLAVPPALAFAGLTLAVTVTGLLLLALRPSRLENPFVVAGGVMACTTVLTVIDSLGALLGRRRRGYSPAGGPLSRASRARRSAAGRNGLKGLGDGSALIGDPQRERDHVLGLRGVFHDDAEWARYVNEGWERVQVVLRLMTDLRERGVRRVLELGANPYVLTLLLRRRLDFDLELANYFGDEPPGGAERVQAGELQGVPAEFRFRHFNVERDPFPYGDAAFDCVLFCEILEHLLLDPDRAVAEIARVVRPGGFVVISTPNATRLSNLYFLALGRSIWDGYSPNGPYGRHNREYSVGEVEALLTRHGFVVDRAEVRNLQRVERRIAILQRLRPRVWYDHLFVVGRKPE
jgi:SAM-dependent methyltransferase